MQAPKERHKQGSSKEAQDTKSAAEAMEGGLKEMEDMVKEALLVREV